TTPSSPLASSSNYIFLINGNLQIMSSLLIPAGSTAMFSSSGDTTIAATVGETTPYSSCTAPTTADDVDGIFSADKNFIIATAASCPTTPDKQLIMSGAITANAAGSGGLFQMKRSLCGTDALTPAFLLKERPDFVLNAPELFKTTNTVYSEIEP